MSKSHLSVAQRVVSSVWKAMRMLEGRSEPPPKVKLNGRPGYGDGDIPLPDRTPTANDPKPTVKRSKMARCLVGRVELARV
jgi:hypothetical protein